MKKGKHPGETVVPLTAEIREVFHRLIANGEIDQSGNITTIGRYNAAIVDSILSGRGVPKPINLCR